MDHANIVKLFEYTENTNDIVAFMEYCNDPSYLETQIYNKKREIKDERLLKSIAS
jgi:serine/threonine protein kinase